MSSPAGEGSRGSRETIMRNDDVDHVLAKLKDAGFEIDDETARVIGEEITRIKTEATGPTRQEETGRSAGGVPF
ncbi:hypothetical protein ACP4OV_011778 [Aristida adscensionis]